MVKRPVDRRSILTGLAATALMPRVAAAEDVIDLTWRDLLPKGDTYAPSVLDSLIDHDSPPLSSQQPASSGVRTDWNGRIVRLPPIRGLPRTEDLRRFGGRRRPLLGRRLQQPAHAS